MLYIYLILILFNFTKSKSFFDRVKKSIHSATNEDKQRYFLFDSQTGTYKPFEENRFESNSNHNRDIDFDDFASYHRTKYNINRFHDPSLRSSSQLSTSKQELILKIAGGIAWLFVTNAVWKRLISFGEKFLEINSFHPSAPSNVLPFLAPNTTLNNYEIEISSAVIDPASIVEDVTSVGGLNDVKYALWDCVKTSINNDLHISQSNNNNNNRNKFSNQRLLNPVSGVLLYGPPGCGKTLLAKAVAKKASMPLIHITPSLLLRKWVGESSLLTKAIFTLAKKLQPCILFIDEMDALLRSRFDQEMSVDRNLKTEFMQLWDGLINDGSRVMVIGASNRPQDLDAAIQRRFERSFLIALPNHKSRIEVLKVMLRGVSVDYDFDWSHAASLTQGYTPSDLQALCKAAASIPLKEAYRKRKIRKRKEIVQRRKAGSITNGTKVSINENNENMNHKNHINVTRGKERNNNELIMEDIMRKKANKILTNEMNDNNNNKKTESSGEEEKIGMSILDEMRPLTLYDLKEAANSVFPTQWSAASYGEVSKGYQPGNVVEEDYDNDDNDNVYDMSRHHYKEDDDEFYEDFDTNTDNNASFHTNSDNNSDSNTNHYYDMDMHMDDIDEGEDLNLDHDSSGGDNSDTIQDDLDDDDNET